MSVSDIEYIDFKKDRYSRSRDDNHIFLRNYDPNKEKGNYEIRMNEKITNLILSKKVEFVRVARNKITGQKYLVFTKDSSCLPISMPTSKRKVVAIFSKQMLQCLRNLIGLTEHEQKCWVSEDISNSEDILTIEIKRA